MVLILIVILGVLIWFKFYDATILYYLTGAFDEKLSEKLVHRYQEG